MKIIGLTGGIGSGKSTVLELFKTLGAQAYVADIEAKKLMNTDDELIKQISNLFGELAYVNNELNRNYISSIVFNNPKMLQALNELVHPKVHEHFKLFLKSCNNELVLYEAAILFESGNYKMCDYIISVIANLEDKLMRVVKRDVATKQQVMDRMKHQTTDEFRIKNSHVVIRNNNLKNTKIQVLTAFDLLVKLN